MPPIDHSASEASQDLAFERRLLESARADGMPVAEVQAAWARFAGATAALTTLAAGAHTARGAQLTAKLAIAKWLVIGACCGSSLTAIWLRSMPSAPELHGLLAARSAAPRKSDDSVLGAPSGTETPSGVVADAASALPQAVLPGNASATQIGPPLNGARRAANDQRLRLRAGSRSLGPAAPEPVREQRAARTSTLGAEVSLLDAARRASFASAPNEALSLIDDYHHQFPTGELSADAEVVAIDALAAQHASQLGERAARFLERYPNDPHAAHVRMLVRGQ